MVKKILCNSIYLENCIPLPLREILLYEAELHLYTTKSFGSNESTVEVEAMTTMRLSNQDDEDGENEATILKWTKTLSMHMDKGDLKCFFIELRRECVSGTIRS